MSDYDDDLIQQWFIFEAF